MKNCIGGLIRFIAAVIVLLVAAVLIAYYYYSPTLETTLADSIRREFMLPPSSTVVVTRGSLLDTLEGEVTRLLVESPEAKVDGLTVRNLTLLGEGIHINVISTIITGQAEFKEITHSEVSLQVSEEALEDRWGEELRKKGLGNVQVTLDDEIGITGSVDLKVTKIQVAAQGVIEVEDSERIRFTVTELNLGGAEIGLRDMEATFSAMSPLIDLGSLKLNLVVDEVLIGDGMLLVSAHSRSLGEKLGADRKAIIKRREDDTISGATDEDLIDQIGQLMKVDGEERSQQAQEVMEQLKERGIETGGQLSKFMGKQFENLQDEYQVVLKELNKLIESQIDAGGTEGTEAKDPDEEQAEEVEGDSQE